MKRIYATLARFLDAVAEATEPLDVGMFGPETKYTKFERVRIGPLINALAASGYLKQAGANNSRRPSRNGALVRTWLAGCATSCRQKAAEYRLRAERIPDDGSVEPSQQRQQLLF